LSHNGHLKNKNKNKNKKAKLVGSKSHGHQEDETCTLGGVSLCFCPRTRKKKVFFPHFYPSNDTLKPERYYVFFESLPPLSLSGNLLITGSFHSDSSRGVERVPHNSQFMLLRPGFFWLTSRQPETAGSGFSG